MSFSNWAQWTRYVTWHTGSGWTVHLLVKWGTSGTYLQENGAQCWVADVARGTAFLSEVHMPEEPRKLVIEWLGGMREDTRLGGNWGVRFEMGPTRLLRTFESEMVESDWRRDRLGSTWLLLSFSCFCHLSGWFHGLIACLLCMILAFFFFFFLLFKNANN